MGKYKNELARAVIVFFIIVVVCLVTVGLFAPTKNNYKSFKDNTTQTLAELSADIALTKEFIESNAKLIESLQNEVETIKSNASADKDSLLVMVNNFNRQIIQLNANFETQQQNINSVIVQLGEKISREELAYFKGVIDNDMILLANMQEQINTMQTTITALITEVRGQSIVGAMKLIGEEDYVATVSSGANSLFLIRFQCTKSGILSIIRARITNYGGLKVAVYSDNESKPTNLLSSNTYDNIVSAGWATISIPPINLIEGQYYWIAYDTATVCLGWTSEVVGLIWYKAMPYSNLVFPAVIGSSTGFTSDKRTCLISGWAGY